MSKIEQLHDLYTEAADVLWNIKWHKSADQTAFLSKNYRDEKIAKAVEEFARISLEITRLQFGAVLDEMDLGKSNLNPVFENILSTI